MYDDKNTFSSAHAQQSDWRDQHKSSSVDLYHTDW